MDLYPVVTVDCGPLHSLLSVVLVVGVHFLEELIKLSLHHSVESQRVWLSFPPSVNVNTKHHQDGWSQENGCEVVNDQRIVNG